MTKAEYERVRTELAKEYNKQINELKFEIDKVKSENEELRMKLMEMTSLKAQNAKLWLLSNLSNESISKLALQMDLQNYFKGKKGLRINKFELYFHDFIKETFEFLENLEVYLKKELYK